MADDCLGQRSSRKEAGGRENPVRVVDRGGKFATGPDDDVLQAAAAGELDVRANADHAFERDVADSGRRVNGHGPVELRRIFGLKVEVVEMTVDGEVLRGTPEIPPVAGIEDRAADAARLIANEIAENGDDGEGFARRDVGEYFRFEDIDAGEEKSLAPFERGDALADIEDGTVRRINRNLERTAAATEDHGDEAPAALMRGDGLLDRQVG